jgi:phosphomevalonate kinase
VKIRATAPAKLILTGEYAVLEGAPAVVAALDRRVKATVQEAERWSLTSDLESSPIDLEKDADGVLYLADGRRAVEVDSTRLLALVAEHFDAPPLDVRLESGALRITAEGAKLGLGSSAAVAVALHTATRRLLEARELVGRVDDAAMLTEALDLHRRLQAGKGSGVDVGASFTGGLLRFERGAGDTAAVHGLPWPRGLSLGVVWTGRAASTTGFLDRLQAARSARPGPVADALRRLHLGAGKAADAFEQADVTRILAEVDAYREALDGLGEAIGAEILSAPHRALADVARDSGAVYKPSGAGGGDVGVILAGSDRNLEAALDLARQRGFTPVFAALDRQGVLVTEA